MARIQQTGAEWQSTAVGVELGSVSGSLSIDTSVMHGGNASYKVSGSIPNDDVQEGELPPLGSQTNVYIRTYVYVEELPNNVDAVVYLSGATSGGVSIFSVQLYNDSGTLTGIAYYNDFASSSSAFTTNLAFDEWLCLEIHFDSTPANGSEVLEVRVNGDTVVNLNSLNFASKALGLYNFGIFNGTGGAINTEVVYFDDIAVNDTSGSTNNSWCGEGKIVAAVPSAAGDNDPTAGTFASVNEIPATDTATSSANRIELDNNGTIADFNITDTATLGINSYDTINAILVLVRLREEAAATTSYQLRIKSASGGSVTSTTAADAGNATVRTNPNGTTAFGRLLISETDPTTGIAWTPTGTNSLDNAQIGISSGTANDIWATAMAAMVDYTEGTPPAVGDESQMLVMF